MVLLGRRRAQAAPPQGPLQNETKATRPSPVNHRRNTEPAHCRPIARSQQLRSRAQILSVPPPSLRRWTRSIKRLLRAVVEAGAPPSSTSSRCMISIPGTIHSTTQATCCWRLSGSNQSFASRTIPMKPPSLWTSPIRPPGLSRYEISITCRASHCARRQTDLLPPRLSPESPSHERQVALQVATPAVRPLLPVDRNAKQKLCKRFPAGDKAGATAGRWPHPGCPRAEARSRTWAKQPDRAAAARVRRVRASAPAQQGVESNRDCEPGLRS